MSGGSPGGAAPEEGYPVAPLLERSALDSGGPIEVGLSMTGTEPIDENELDVFVPRARIDPGERIELGIFVSGVGDVDENDLSVFYDDAAVLDLEDPGVVRRNDASATEPPAESAGEFPDGSTGEHPGGAGDRSAPTAGDRSAPTADGRTTASADGDPLAAADGQVEAGLDGHPESEGANATPTEYVESATFRRPPTRRGAGLEHVPLGGSSRADPGYILELNTRRSAPAGEYPVPVIFTYRSDDGIKQVKRKPTVRIRGWRERWRPWLLGLALLVLILAVIAIRGGPPL